MYDEPIPMLARQIGSNGRQIDPPLFGRGSRQRFTVADAQCKAHSTLTHWACYELTRMGTALIHSPCNERPRSLCNANLII